MAGQSAYQKSWQASPMPSWQLGQVYFRKWRSSVGGLACLAKADAWKGKIMLSHIAIASEASYGANTQSLSGLRSINFIFGTNGSATGVPRLHQRLRLAEFRSTDARYFHARAGGGRNACQDRSGDHAGAIADPRYHSTPKYLGRRKLW
ncbi:hypothetical protein G6F57_021520 [Rhizopus arrhizus]|nr:hypothetical protein G6F57_021520 [Rhizopus arrhizus]